MAVQNATVFLIPSLLAEGQLSSLPPVIAESAKQCRVFYVEQARTARRFLKQIWKEIPIDDLEWVVLNKEDPNDPAVLDHFRKSIRGGLTVGILSEAGCPGIADPGQALAAVAQTMGARVKPLTGPSSILLALMASGLNGQQFRFWGYLPVDARDRQKTIRMLEEESARANCTQVFIETPYRNQALLQALIAHCRMHTRLCVAADLTGPTEWVRTQTIGEWKNQLPDLHKRPAIFCLHAG